MPDACNLPCWRGLKPNETSEDLFIQESKAFPALYSNLERFEDSETIIYHWFDNEAKRNLTIFFKKGDQSSFIRTGGSDLKLADSLSSFGQPDNYVAEMVATEELGSLYVAIFYEESGIMIDQFIYPYPVNNAELSSCSVTIDLDFPIHFVYFTMPNSSKEMAKAVGSPFYSEPKAWQQPGQINLTACN